MIRNREEYDILQKRLKKLDGICNDVYTIKNELYDYQTRMKCRLISKKRLSHLNKIVDEVSINLGVKLKLELKTESYGSFIYLSVFSKGNKHLWTKGWDEVFNDYQKPANDMEKLLVFLKNQKKQKNRNDHWDLVFNLVESFRRCNTRHKFQNIQGDKKSTTSCHDI